MIESTLQSDPYNNLLLATESLPNADPSATVELLLIYNYDKETTYTADEDQVRNETVSIDGYCK